MSSVPPKPASRPTVAQIDLAALAQNLDLARDLVGTELKLLAVVKANAYGHGAVPVARTLEKRGAHALAVATPEEGTELRQAGLKLPIFCLAGPFQAPGELFTEQKLSPVLFQEEQLEHLQKTSRQPLNFHLKIDTGMTRLGVLPENLAKFLERLKNYDKLKLSGVMTHLASADETFEGPTAQQYQRFTEAAALVQSQYPEAQIMHIANSAAILGKKLGPCHWARPGIMLYGANPNPRFNSELKAVMSFQTKILSVKEVAKGTAVSYGGEWVAPKTSRIAVLPVGYADGYPRHLSNRGEVLIKGQRAPVAGRVCMDLTMIDVTQIPDAAPGDEVLLWGPGLPAEEVAQKAGTISYELFCGVSPRVPRRYREAP